MSVPASGVSSASVPNTSMSSVAARSPSVSVSVGGPKASSAGPSMKASGSAKGRVEVAVIRSVGTGWPAGVVTAAIERP